jgi:eukaryotic-like serine/threonine-protein kinase
MTDNSERVRAALAGRYPIERELGRGGMAMVYLARDLKYERLVALKVLRPELAAVLGAERFLREIRLTAQLQHPHILTLIDSGEADGFLYYVMPYVEGESLRHRLAREGQLPLDEALSHTRAIASALDFAHAHGVIHRDIKPENVMLHQGEPMVADFGIALAVSTAGHGRLTETGITLGTPAYMSPEQASGARTLDGRSDQYSLACVLYEMLAGEPPYTGPTAQAIFAKSLTEPVPHLGTVRPVSPAVEAAVTKALAKTPADRFTTAGAFGAALTAGSTRATHTRWRGARTAVAALIIISGAAAWFYASQNSKGGQSHANVVPFTSSPGQKSDPVFSPGGNEIAYTWKGENDDNSDIYVKLIGAGGPLRLTSSPAEEYCPAWSPDGRYIAFMRDGPSGDRAYYLIPALGGAERKIGEAYGQRQLYEECLDWSRDGKYLLVADRMAPEDARSSILLLSVEDGQRRVLVSQPDLYVANPIGSPDGTAVAYVQGAGFVAGDIYVAPVSGGPPRRVTADGRSLNGLAWTADGKEIVFASNRGGLWRLWRVSTSGGRPELVNGVGEGAGAPTISPRGDRLAYVQARADANLWRTEGPASKGRRAAPEKVIASSRQDWEGVFSPDGKRIAFGSDRSGSVEIWICNSDGSNQAQLTSLTAADAGSSSWSPDGKTIAFDARLEGHGDIFVINADGGSPRRLTTEPVENNVPTWSRDGKWIYFSSNRTGSWQIWKVPAVGGSAIQVTSFGGFRAEESADAKFLYVWVEGDGGTIRRMRPSGEETTTRILQGVSAFAWWRIAPDGIYFVDGSTTPARVRFFHLATKRVTTITTLDLGYSHPALGFDVSPDGQWILFKRVDQVASDIMVVENFR